MILLGVDLLSLFFLDDVVTCHSSLDLFPIESPCVFFRVKLIFSSTKWQIRQHYFSRVTQSVGLSRLSYFFFGWTSKEATLGFEWYSLTSVGCVTVFSSFTSSGYGGGVIMEHLRVL